MFRGLITNEFIKLFAKKKTYIILILFVALSGIFVAVNEATENNYLKYNSPQYRLDNVNDQIVYQQKYLDEIKAEETYEKEEKEKLLAGAESYLQVLVMEKTDLEKEVVNYTQDNWADRATKQLEEYKLNLDNATEDMDKIYYQNEIDRIQIHLDKNIPLDDMYMNSGINYYINNITMVATGFLAFGLILFCGDSVSNEYNPATLKFLLIQPVSRIKILLSKYFVMLFSSLGLIMITQFLFFLGVGLVKGLGNFARPILVDSKYEFITQNGYKVLKEITGSGHYINLSSYLIRALLLQGLFIIVMVTFIFMVSTLVKSGIVSLTINIAALMGANIIYSLSTSYRKISPFVFIHFSNIEGIISGNVVAGTNNLIFTYQTVIIVSFISILVCMGIALTVFKKRDIQI